jgi:hypothetical protein
MSRNLGAIIGAIIGAIVGTIDNVAHGGVDDSINWYAEGVGHAAPWLIIGGLMGFLSGRSSSPKKT